MDPTVTPHPSPASRTRRALALVRRWLLAVAGLGLLVITLSGTLLPHQTEILRSLSPAASSSDAGPGQVSLPQAVEVVENAHPDEPVLSARWDTDVVEVRTERATYAIDPSTGHEISRASAAPAWVAVLDNLHRCLLSCRGPGHVHWMSQEIPHTDWWAGRRSLTVGGLVVATAGVVLVVLTVSGLCTWWPLQRYRRTALSSHWRTQRLSRDTDLLKAAGLVLLPLLFLWGYYASAFSIRPTQPASPVSMTAHQSPAEPTSAGRARDIGPHRAVAAAQEAGGGQAVALFLPQAGDPSSTYTVWISQGARFAPRKSPDDVAVSIAVNVDPGTGRTTLPSAPGHRPTTRAD
ncbi:PepSY-associated TM helix domain-containing protein [Actinomyces sp.]|uniref:PepSY-associated TM helix domain-containing protein n=1 Tax=Actinomyces sp. TaxID=29317 RepID=UPI0026DB64C4|nr:PepSY-associated TM helix domain-containing protein [Actinomyces sp.]MDO4654792.1 PepSY-associated TM helix domain-containing protein [Actinomyces sp.]